MRKLLLAAVALAMWSPLAVYPAYAVPSFCPGTIVTVTSGQNEPGSFFLTGSGTSTGNCVLASDKWIGGFSVSGAITGAGSGVFTFTMPQGPANVQLGVQGSLAASSTGTINYSVMVNPALSNGAMIDDIGKDFTLGAANVTGAASATETGSASATSFMWDCTRTVNPATSTCPQDATFALVSTTSVTDTFMTGTNAVITGLTDTISQAVPGVPEPASLAMLGTSLAMLGFVGWRRRQR